jgi:serine/threonine protein kinase
LNIGDFGFIKKIDEEFMSTYCGSPNYIPPEIKVGGIYLPTFSLGIVLFPLITRLHEITLGDIKGDIQKDADFLKNSKVSSFRDLQKVRRVFPS